MHQSTEFWISMSKSRLFSDQGRSFSFDSRGTGYGRGEGCGMIVLKPLHQALKDNDVIRSVILGSGINQDGKTPGITMPNGSAQEALMKSVYKNAGIDPKETGYVEAHGTGTKVGDPIEAAALHNTFGEGRTARNPLFIGSVKSNIGHLEAASGIISVIKTALMLERGFILPNYDFKKPNEKIPFAQWGLKVPISQRPWPRPKRFASVNNFGFGGTNAHVVMERAPFQPDLPESEDHGHDRKLFVLSANDKNALETMMKKIGIYLEQRPAVFQNDLMSNVAYTLGERRSLMQWRVAISTTSSIDLIQALNSGKVVPSRETESPRIGFIFTGQGAQWNAMGRELYEHYPVFKTTLDACSKFLESLGSPFSLIEELLKDAETSLINEAYISQPACTAIQLALVDLLRAWGITPHAVAGHSSGEIGAAYAANIIPLEACMTIAYYRGMASIELKKKNPGLKGTMMAVGCTKEEVEPLIASLTTGEVKIACYNSPTSLTISGDEAAIDELGKIMEEKQMFNRKLQVDIAYHSHHMEKVADYYRQFLSSLQAPQSTDVKFHSSLLGCIVDGPQLESSYWVDNLTKSVRFSEAVTSMCEPADGNKTGVNMLVEIGPHSALAGPIKQIVKACGPNATKIPYVSALVRKKDAVETAQELASTLFVKGATLDMGAVNLPNPGKQPALLVDMPRYPWNHQTKYWHESRIMQKHKNRSTPRTDLLGTIATYSNDLEPTWRNILRIDDLPWLRHHKIQGLTLFPMSGFVSMAVEAASQHATQRNVNFETFELRDVAVHTPLMVTDEDIEMTLQLRPSETSSSETWDEFLVHSWTSNKGWTEHCKGLIAVKTVNAGNFDTSRQAQITESSLQSSISEVKDAAKEAVDKAKLYDSLSALGVEYGPSFQGMNDCKSCDNASSANLVVVDTAHEMPSGFQTNSVIHPALLEQLIEMYWPILGAGRNSVDTIYLPSSIGSMTISKKVTELTKKAGDSLSAYCKATPPSSNPKPIQASMFAISTSDDVKELIIGIDELTVTPILDGSAGSESDSHRELCYKMELEPILDPLQDSAVDGTLTNGASDQTIEVGNKASKIEGDMVIIHEDSSAQLELATHLAFKLETLTGSKPVTGILSDTDATGKLCLIITELENPLLSTLTSLQFSSLQKTLTTARGVLWVVRGAYTNSKTPDYNMVTGLSRSIRSETLLRFATLDLDAESTLNQEDTGKAILKVFRATFETSSSPQAELEFIERKGSFFTPRIVNDAEMNEYVHKQTKTSMLELASFEDEARPLQIEIGTPGALESLYFVDQTREERLLDDEIEIKVKAMGLNSRDVCVAMGQLDSQSLGMECSGVVSNIGKDVTNVAVGDHVAAVSINQGTISTYARTKAAFAMKFGNKMSFDAAASMPLAFCTAQYGLVDLGRLESETRVLIHGASNAVGQAAIRLAQSIGADVHATVDSAESKALIQKMYGLTSDHIYSSSNTTSIRQAAGKDGFDIVLSCVSTDSEMLRALWDSLDSFGRLVNIAVQGSSMKLDTTRSQQNRAFMSVDLIALATEKPKLMKTLVNKVAKQLEECTISPISSTVFPISDIETALKTLQSGNTDGKIILSVQKGDKVNATPSSKGGQLLCVDATYILIGGTGGLGRSMARWMVGKGARTIVLVSRSGSATGKVKELIGDLATSGANIIVKKCDVADREAVENLINNELTGLPPVRGVIHGAMVLNDVLFEKMTHTQYTTVLSSKYHGAWNFHHALTTQPQPLDFFIALSSAAGAVGNRGQAAYAAANTFLNAFIQHRHSLGLPGSSIDLTAVSDAGYLSENAAAAAER
ncbi:putative Phthioceranic/hydroxyphthioceranic acid synthase [Glarea lozoyensis 74030]|uniref:Putative Phthioceranic/hydroxyphthioceranic acid synthase n=1 Tax=Glarea lozoyensis (strain ATCC 74030 / MF5533) TaxID=1104152 RepID=H0EXT4_GLAL7|nr:putative Phthioceranic/hydroxyphthioceranic acid synthase [Glarea lozoyensis 74030]